MVWHEFMCILPFLFVFRQMGHFGVAVFAQQLLPSSLSTTQLEPTKYDSVRALDYHSRCQIGMYLLFVRKTLPALPACWFLSSHKLLPRDFRLNGVCMECASNHGKQLFVFSTPPKATSLCNCLNSWTTIGPDLEWLCGRFGFVCVAQLKIVSRGLIT